MGFYLMFHAPPLTPPETGGEHANQDVSQYRKLSNRSNIYRPPLQKGDKRGIHLD